MYLLYQKLDNVALPRNTSSFRLLLLVMQRNLDILRAIAVLLVLIGHLFLYNYQQKPYTDLFSIMGRTGVLIFFVHTSYVLMYSIDRLFEKHKNLREVVTTFYIRRLFRIYPLAIFSITIVTLPIINPPIWVLLELIGKESVMNMLLDIVK